MKINMAYGSGGVQTGSLIHDIFLKHFNNSILNRLEDSAVVRMNGTLAYTTDSFVVTPLFFPGGDIGKLAVCGTVNDLTMMGAIPKYLTTGFFWRRVRSRRLWNRLQYPGKGGEGGKRQNCGGGTKVIEGKGGIYINTSGIGEIAMSGVSVSNCKPGDIILLSGNLGEHHAAILSQRMGIENTIRSDCAPLTGILKSFLKENIKVRFMRDVTRGGLATILNEITQSSHCGVEIEESSLPISREIKGFCDILGLDPLYMANEGKLLAVVPEKQAEKALSAIRRTKYGKNAAIIGRITEGNNVTMKTPLMGRRRIDVLYGEGLPRIC
jgi:hydrogenase expression/formation protein HypE